MILGWWSMASSEKYLAPGEAGLGHPPRHRGAGKQGAKEGGRRDAGPIYHRRERTPPPRGPKRKRVVTGTFHKMSRLLPR